MKKEETNHIESVDDGEDITSLKPEEVFESARLATEGEHNLTFREAIKLYPWAIFWAFVLSLTIVMEGYDGNLIGNFYA